MSKIEINNITKTFNDVTALKNVNVNFEENHIYGLLDATVREKPRF